jgi:hypothetical protein
MAVGQVFSEYFGFLCQTLFHQLLHNHHHLSWGWYNRPVVAAVPSGLSLTPLDLAAVGRIRNGCGEARIGLRVVQASRSYGIWSHTRGECWNSSLVGVPLTLSRLFPLHKATQQTDLLRLVVMSVLVTPLNGTE